jgi:hypothetical protein
MRALLLLPITLALLGSTLPGQGVNVVYLDREIEITDDPQLAIEGLVCLQAVLGFQGLEVDLATLRVLSGDAWAPLLFCDQVVYEPLRERTLVDTLTLACDALGVEAAWHTDLSTEQAVEVARAAIEQEHPVIASRLIAPREQCGYQVLISANRLATQVMAHAVNDPRRRAVLTPPERWSGHVTGSVMWANTPLFTTAVPGSAEVPAPAEQWRIALRSWEAQTGPRTIPLSEHSGTRRFTGLTEEELAAGPTAHVGVAAAEAFAVRIRTVEDLDDFSTLWQVRTLLGQLITRREAAIAFLESLDIDDREDKGAIIEAVRREIELATQIRDLMWDQRCQEIQTASELIRSVRRLPPLVVNLNPLPSHERQLVVETLARWPQDYEMERRSTRWGPILTVDSPEQRERVAELFEQIADAFEQTAALMDSSAHGPEPVAD